MKRSAAGDDTPVEEISADRASVNPAGGSDPPSGEPFAPGTIVGHFRVMRMLGHGGMGEVHLARDLKLGRKVALKVVHPRQFASEDTMKRFLLEARMTARFNHPHIVTLYEVGEHEGRPYLALEYLQGEDLSARLLARSLSVRESIRIGLAIAEALAEAHQHGVLHRDLKPGNVMIGRDGRVRVLDFGLSKALPSQESPPSTRALSGSEPPPPMHAAEPSNDDGPPSAPGAEEAAAQRSWGVGTPRYMAPEQWREQEGSTKTDMWAFGVVLYGMLARRLPFQKSQLRDQAWAVCNWPAPPIGDFVTLPTSLAELVHRCLEKKPEERPSAKEAVAVLQDLLAASGKRAKVTDNPFRGLLPFGAEHADMFFGRDAEIASFVERVRLQPVLPVVGASGAGKSSFVRAGVVPRLEEQEPWVILTLRPGSRPFHSLALRLLRGDGHTTLSSSLLRRKSGDEPTATSNPESDDAEEAATEPDTAASGDAAVEDDAVERLAEALREQPARVGIELRKIAEERRANVMLFVDQLEELFTMGDDAGAQKAFLEAICAATDDVTDPVRVVFTVRDDFLGRLAVSARTREVLSQVIVIQRPDEQALVDILTQPVKLLGHRYDDALLVDEMVAAVGGEPSCLPLLQFAAHRLWERRDRDAKLLTRKAYDAMGGVEGALARHADGVLATMAGPDARLARELLLRMVTPERTRRVIERERALEGLGGHGSDVLSRLTEARLVSASKVIGREGVVTMLELAHESLISTWSRLSRWIDESRDDLAFMAEVGQAADLWDRRGRRAEELWQGDALRECLRSKDRVSAELPELVKTFIAESEARERSRARRRRVTTLSGVVLLALVALGATMLALFVRNQRDAAREQRADALREGSRAALARGQLMEARAKLREALEAKDSASARALWWQLSSEPRIWGSQVGSAVYAVALSRDGRFVAAPSQDGPVYLIDTGTREMRILRGHTDQALSVAFSPDGRLLASGSLDKTVRLWNVARGQPEAVLRGHQSGAHGVAFSSDGTLVAAGGYDHTARIFDVPRRELVRTFVGHDSAVRGVAFSADGKLLATAGSDRTARIWEVATTKTRVVLEGHEREVFGVAFSPDGKTLATGSYDATLRLWSVDGKGPARVLRGHESGVSLIAFDDSGRVLASSGADKTARLWDVDSGRQLRRLELDAQVTGVALSPDGTRLASSTTAGGVALWDLTVASSSQPHDSGHGSPVSGADISPDGRSIASGGFDNRVLVWSADTGELVRALVGHQDAVGAVAFAPDGKLLASAGKDRTVRLWNPQTGEPGMVLTGHRAEIFNIAFSPDGRRLATGSYDQTVRLWDTRTGAAVAVLEGHRDRVRGVAFSPDGKLLGSAGYDRMVRLWDLDTFENTTTLSGHEHRVYGVSFTPDSKHVVSGSYDETVRVWDVESGEGRLLGRHPGRVYSLAFHPHDDVVGAPSSNGDARLWNLNDGSFRVLSGHRNEVNTLRFDARGTLAVTASDDGTVRLWNVAEARPQWRAPAVLMLGDEPRMFSHRGWRGFDGDAKPAPERPYRDTIEKDARLVRQSPDGALLCIQRYDDQLELWPSDGAARLGIRAIADLRRVSAFDGGCLVLAGSKASIVATGGGVTNVDLEGARAIGVGGGRLLVTSDATAVVLQPSGAVVASKNVAPGVSAIGLDGEALLLGYADGNLEVLPLQAGVTRTTVGFDNAPSSPVEVVMAGPKDTLIAAYANGLIGIWDRSDGVQLARTALHGPITHLLVSGANLYAASDLGHATRWDLSAFHADYCTLMNELWANVAVVWRDGHPLLAAPPRGHGCRSK